MPLGTYGANKILDHVTGRAEWTMPSVYVSIHDGDPGLGGADEHSYSGYVRKQPATGWNAASTGVPATNDGDITFDEVPAGGIAVTHVGIWDAETSGNFIFGFSIPTRNFPAGTTPKILDEAIEIIAQDNFSDYLKPLIVNHMLGASSYTMPSSVYLAVIDDGGSEFTGGGYARSETAFDPAASKEIANADEEDYGTASGDLGTTEEWRLYDASSSGNVLVFGEWDTPAEVLNGDGYKVVDGGLTITAV
ncbi:MAG: hypothetical protein AB7I96_10210 [Candidatus Dadabacteria bacterium]